MSLMHEVDIKDLKDSASNIMHFSDIVLLFLNIVKRFSYDKM